MDTTIRIKEYFIDINGSKSQSISQQPTARDPLSQSVIKFKQNLRDQTANPYLNKRASNDHIKGGVQKNQLNYSLDNLQMRALSQQKRYQCPSTSDIKQRYKSKFQEPKSEIELQRIFDSKRSPSVPITTFPDPGFLYYVKDHHQQPQQSILVKKQQKIVVNANQSSNIYVNRKRNNDISIVKSNDQTSTFSLPGTKSQSNLLSRPQTQQRKSCEVNKSIDDKKQLVQKQTVDRLNLLKSIHSTKNLETEGNSIDYYQLPHPQAKYKLPQSSVNLDILVQSQNKLKYKKENLIDVNMRRSANIRNMKFEPPSRKESKSSINSMKNLQVQQKNLYAKYKLESTSMNSSYMRQKEEIANSIVETINSNDPIKNLDSLKLSYAQHGLNAQSRKQSSSQAQVDQLQSKKMINAISAISYGGVTNTQERNQIKKTIINSGSTFNGQISTQKVLKQKENPQLPVMTLSRAEKTLQKQSGKKQQFSVHLTGRGIRRLPKDSNSYSIKTKPSSPSKPINESTQEKNETHEQDKEGTQKSQTPSLYEQIFDQKDNLNGNAKGQSKVSQSSLQHATPDFNLSKGQLLKNNRPVTDKSSLINSVHTISNSQLNQLFGSQSRDSNEKIFILSQNFGTTKKEELKQPKQISVVTANSQSHYKHNNQNQNQNGSGQIVLSEATQQLSQQEEVAIVIENEDTQKGVTLRTNEANGTMRLSSQVSFNKDKGSLLGLEPSTGDQEEQQLTFYRQPRQMASPSIGTDTVTKRVDGSSEDGTLGIIQINTFPRELSRGGTQQRLHNINEGPSTGSCSPVRIVKPTLHKAKTLKQNHMRGNLSRGGNFPLQKMNSGTSLDSEGGQQMQDNVSSSIMSFKQKTLKSSIILQRHLMYDQNDISLDYGFPQNPQNLHPINQHPQKKRTKSEMTFQQTEKMQIQLLINQSIKPQRHNFLNSQDIQSLKQKAKGMTMLPFQKRQLGKKIQQEYLKISGTKNRSQINIVEKYLQQQ